MTMIMDINEALEAKPGTFDNTAIKLIRDMAKAVAKSGEDATVICVEPYLSQHAWTDEVGILIEGPDTVRIRDWVEKWIDAQRKKGFKYSSDWNSWYQLALKEFDENHVRVQTFSRMIGD